MVPSRIDRVIISDRIDMIMRDRGLLGQILEKRIEIDTRIERKIVERTTQTIFQSMLDVGIHILAKKSLSRPKGYSEVFSIMLDHNIISEGLKNRLDGLAGLRDLLVHDYFDIDYDLLKGHAESLFNDSLTFIEEIRKYVK